MPTTESSSPTATSAVNEKRRPPLTTFATRLISITRSCRSSPLAETCSTLIGRWRVESSKFQASLAGAVGQGLDSPVVAVAATVEDALGDTGVGGALGDRLARLRRLLHRRKAAQVGLGPV